MKQHPLFLISLTSILLTWTLGCGGATQTPDDLQEAFVPASVGYVDAGTELLTATSMLANAHDALAAARFVDLWEATIKFVTAKELDLDKEDKKSLRFLSRKRNLLRSLEWRPGLDCVETGDGFVLFTECATGGVTIEGFVSNEVADEISIIEAEVTLASEARGNPHTTSFIVSVTRSPDLMEGSIVIEHTGRDSLLAFDISYAGIELEAGCPIAGELAVLTTQLDLETDVSSNTASSIVYDGCGDAAGKWWRWWDRRLEDRSGN